MNQTGMIGYSLGKLCIFSGTVQNLSVKQDKQNKQTKKIISYKDITKVNLSQSFHIF